MQLSLLTQLLSISDVLNYEIDMMIEYASCLIRDLTNSQVSQAIEISPQLTPGHKGIEGNELADALAKRAARDDSLHLHSFVSPGYLKQHVKATFENLQWQQPLTGVWTRFPTRPNV